MKTQFTKVVYSLSTLVDYIELGTIGLPDIQRPFIWKTPKVRDLFDQCIRGILSVIFFSGKMGLEMGGNK